MARWLTVILVCAASWVACLAQQSSAVDDAYQEQVDAATARAVRELFDEVSSAHIDDQITVREFLNRTRGQDELLATLQRAEQIGGPRWIDDQTCQVQLEISGARVARTLSQIAASKPQRSPIDPDVLEMRLAPWRSRTFSTTGASTGAQRAERFRPPPGNPRWDAIDDKSLSQAIGDAKYDAVIGVFERIEDVALTPKSTVGEALENQAVADQMHRWFAKRPVTNMEFRDNLEVEVTLSAPPAEIADRLRDAVTAQREVAGPDDEAAWNRVRDQIVAAAAMASPIGVGSVASETVSVQPSTAQVHALNIATNIDPPAWVNRRLIAEGVAPKQKSKLRSARAAENDALEKLEAQVRELKLDEDEGVTIDAAAKHDPSFDEAIVRVLRQGKISKTDYDRPDGTVSVVVELDLRDLWEELKEAR